MGHEMQTRNARETHQLGLIRVRAARIHLNRVLPSPLTQFPPCEKDRRWLSS